MQGERGERHLGCLLVEGTVAGRQFVNVAFSHGVQAGCSLCSCTRPIG